MPINSGFFEVCQINGKKTNQYIGSLVMDMDENSWKVVNISRHGKRSIFQLLNGEYPIKTELQETQFSFNDLKQKLNENIDMGDSNWWNSEENHFSGKYQNFLQAMNLCQTPKEFVLLLGVSDNEDCLDVMV